MTNDMTQAAVGIVMHELLNLKLPFVIRSPRSAIVDSPSFWSKRLHDKWVITVFNHEKRDMYIGSGDSLVEAMEDLRIGLDPEKTNELGTIDLPLHKND